MPGKAERKDEPEARRRWGRTIRQAATRDVGCACTRNLQEVPMKIRSRIIVKTGRALPMPENLKSTTSRYIAAAIEFLAALAHPELCT
jgi:hypothetical protein